MNKKNNKKKKNNTLYRKERNINKFFVLKFSFSMMKLNEDIILCGVFRIKSEFFFDLSQ